MNSQLLYRESGFVTADSVKPCAEVSLRFKLPSAAVQSAIVFVSARKVDKAAPSLVFEMNGISRSFDGELGRLLWLSCPIDTKHLRSDYLTINLATQPGWELAYDSVGGEPLIRVRVAFDGANDAVCFPVYGDAAITRDAEAWLAMLPASLRQPVDTWQWCWELAGFLAAAWTYSNETDASSYAPWDARVILKWGRAQADDCGRKPIAMCVHYTISFVQFCIAMGIPARAVVSTSALNSANGHFFAEVWLPQFGSWAMIDPNLHLCYREASTGRPLSTSELSGYRGGLAQLAQFGDGFESQKHRLGSFATAECLSGNVYKYWGVWSRHDWIGRPDLAPPAHGMLAYTEPDIVWCSPDETAVAEFAMFPFHLTAEQLTLAPAAVAITEKS